MRSTVAVARFWFHNSATEIPILPLLSELSYYLHLRHILRTPSSCPVYVHESDTEPDYLEETQPIKHMQSDLTQQEVKVGPETSEGGKGHQLYSPEGLRSQSRFSEVGPGIRTLGNVANVGDVKTRGGIGRNAC